jgi:hypothetical protein
MADELKNDKVTLEELMVSTLAMTDALVKTDDRQGCHHRRRVQDPIKRGAGQLPRRAQRGFTNQRTSGLAAEALKFTA